MLTRLKGKVGGNFPSAVTISGDDTDPWIWNRVRAVGSHPGIRSWMSTIGYEPRIWCWVSTIRY
ncbi:MAG TPA: hypothetical protein VGQ40_01145 [Chthoniobacterales bacterium]|nr:hypothetical protein [Chthoniobacterales bacterium]